MIYISCIYQFHIQFISGISETLGAFNIEFSTPLLGLTGGSSTLAAGASNQQAGVISSTVPTNTGINILRF